MKTETLDEKRARLATMEANLDSIGGRNIPLAESIDELREEIERLDPQRWIDFLANGLELRTAELDELVGEVTSPDWQGGPVEAVLPELVPEYAAISKRLGAAYNREDDSLRKRLYSKTTPAMFKLGCSFGDALEAMSTARHQGDVQGEEDALNTARGVWACILAFSEDYK